jgi:hypothetical protein
MGLKIRIGANFVFRLLVLCLIYTVLTLGSPGLTHSASTAKELVTADIGQETQRALQESSEKGPGTDRSTESHYLSEIRMSLKTLQDQISAIAQQQQEMSKTLWAAERRTFDTKFRTIRFEWYFAIILVIANMVMLLFIFRRRRHIVKVLGITYEASSILAAVKDRQMEMASLIDELKEQIEVLGCQSEPGVSSTFNKLSELLKSNEKSLVTLNHEMGEGGRDRS